MNEYIKKKMLLGGRYLWNCFDPWPQVFLYTVFLFFALCGKLQKHHKTWVCLDLKILSNSSSKSLSLSGHWHTPNQDKHTHSNPQLLIWHKLFVSNQGISHSLSHHWLLAMFLLPETSKKLPTLYEGPNKKDSSKSVCCPISVQTEHTGVCI